MSCQLQMLLHRGAAQYVNLDSNNWIGELEIFIHYPGQIMTKLYKRATLSIDLSEPILITPKYLIGVSQVQILRKRPDSSINCNSDLDSNLDMRWRESIMNTTNCIPTYWKTLEKSSNF